MARGRDAAGVVRVWHGAGAGAGTGCAGDTGVHERLHGGGGVQRCAVPRHGQLPVQADARRRFACPQHGNGGHNGGQYHGDVRQYGAVVPRARLARDLVCVYRWHDNHRRAGDANGDAGVRVRQWDVAGEPHECEYAGRFDRRRRDVDVPANRGGDPLHARHGAYGADLSRGGGGRTDGAVGDIHIGRHDDHGVHRHARAARAGDGGRRVCRFPLGGGLRRACVRLAQRHGAATRPLQHHGRAADRREGATGHGRRGSGSRSSPRSTNCGVTTARAGCGI